MSLSLNWFSYNYCNKFSVLPTEGVEVEGAGHQWVELDLEGVGEEGLHHRNTYCNSSAAVGSSVLLKTGQRFVGHTLTV